MAPGLADVRAALSNYGINFELLKPAHLQLSRKSTWSRLDSVSFQKMK
jgi:hypothetical protein